MATHTKPATKPRWATSGALLSTPSSGKQDIGWIQEKPALQYFNWLFYWIYSWLIYFETKMDDNPITTLVTTASGTTSVTAGSKFIAANCTLGNQTHTLPLAASNDGMQVTLCKTDATANTATLATQGVDTFVFANTTEAIENQGTALTVVAVASLNKWLMR